MFSHSDEESVSVLTRAVTILVVMLSTFAVSAPKKEAHQVRHQMGFLFEGQMLSATSNKPMLVLVYANCVRNVMRLPKPWHRRRL